MNGTITLRSLPSSSSSTRFLEPADLPRRRLPARSVARCSAQKNDNSIPKLEPFNRSKIDRRVKEPSFIQKSESDLTEYCSRLEGDEAYSCWRAYFELKDLENEMPKEDVEKFLRQAGGVKTVIDCLHGLTALDQKHKAKEAKKPDPPSAENARERPCPIPDGLPKTREELEEEEKALMPDSPFTRLLRTKGRMPAWYSKAPDHETD